MKPLFTNRQLAGIVERLAQNKQVRRSLPGWGRLHIDRQLPFICVYRKPEHRPDPGTDRLGVSSAAYLLANESAGSLAQLLEPIVELMSERFGAFLLLEIWSSPSPEPMPENAPPRAAFHIHYRPHGDTETQEMMRLSLQAIRTSKLAAVVTERENRRCTPPGVTPIFRTKKLDELGVHWLGLEVSPIYVNPESGTLYPLLLRAMRRQIGQVLDRVFFVFSHECTTHQPPHYHNLGRRAMVKAVWEIDRKLSAVSHSFDLLSQVTPVNAEKQWLRFQRSGFDRAPRFLYRPRPIDPGRMKRTLYDIPIERVEDPTLMRLFLDKQQELDRELTLLMDLNRPSFVFGSLQLHGRVTPRLLNTARMILEQTPHRTANDAREGVLTAAEFVTRARLELEAYRNIDPTFDGKVSLSDGMYAGLLVAQGDLQVGSELVVPECRAEALIQHEVGTHLLTWSNGRAQPFKMLATGLPGYDELQEGLAVLAEYLVGGFDLSRLRLLAARVLAVHSMVSGASFVEVFRLLSQDYGLAHKLSYSVSMRVFRGGGLVKDAVYLRGLIGILKYLGNGGDIVKLFIGKMAVSHIPMVDELLHRGILIPPKVLPRYLADPQALDRLEHVKHGMTVQDLLDSMKRSQS